MSDLDTQLEDRIRRTLHAVADATPIDEPGSGSPSRRRWQPLAAAAAAAVVLVGAVSVLGSGGGEGGGVTVETPPAAGPSSPLPAHFDLESATPVFVAPGDPDAVALAYMQSRFPDYPRPGVIVQPAAVDGNRAEANWTTGGPDEGVLATGKLHLRLEGDWWTVVAATTDDVDLSGLSYDNVRVEGTIRTADEDALFADVLTWRGEPVHRAPRPEGQPGAAFRFGTAGGPGAGELALDVKHPMAPTVVRVHLVGGTLLSISEVRFDAAPVDRHSDLAGCAERLSNRDEEPTPDIVHRSCAQSLEGEVIASGVAGERTWELVASEEPDGTWVTLRSRDQIGLFRMQADDADFGGRSAEDVPFLSVGPCCGIGDFIGVTAAMHPELQGVRVRLANGDVFDGVESDVLVSGVRYALVTVPQSKATEAEATVEVLTSDGRWRPTGHAFPLAVLGG